MSRLTLIAESLRSEKFLGIPLENFDAVGRSQFIALLQLGMRPESKVLEIGCGVLRAGYWLVRFLNPECYCGIEPHAGRLEIGRTRVLEPDTLAAKRPRFDLNADFDTAVFNETFDFFLAFSIWTHASKPQIETMLDGFLRNAKPDAAFLTSYLPATWWRSNDYGGEKWFGTSHESDVVGCIFHRRAWINQACAKRGLSVCREEKDPVYGQTWLEIRRR